MFIYSVTIFVRLTNCQLLCLEQSEAVPSTSGPSALQTEQQPGSYRPQAPNLAGAVEFSDVKSLLKEWITTISGRDVTLMVSSHASQGKYFSLRFLHFLASSLFLLLVTSHSNIEVFLPHNLGAIGFFLLGCYSVFLTAVLCVASYKSACSLSSPLVGPWSRSFTLTYVGGFPLFVQHATIREIPLSRRGYFRGKGM